MKLCVVCKKRPRAEDRRVCGHCRWQRLKGSGEASLDYRHHNRRNILSRTLHEREVVQARMEMYREAAEREEPLPFHPMEFD